MYDFSTLNTTLPYNLIKTNLIEQTFITLFGLYWLVLRNVLFSLLNNLTDIFLFCYDKDFTVSHSGNNQADTIEAFKSATRYLDDLLSTCIDNPFFSNLLINYNR